MKKYIFLINVVLLFIMLYLFTSNPCEKEIIFPKDILITTMILSIIVGYKTKFYSQILLFAVLFLLSIGYFLFNDFIQILENII